MSDFRLLQLGKDHRGEVLPKGVPTVLSKGVLVTLADADGNVMIEHASASSSTEVKVDGKPVYEVAHVRPLQVIEVDANRFVLMPPYGAFVQPKTGKEPEALKEVRKTKTRKSAKPVRKTKAVAEEPRRLRLVYVAAPALIALLGVAFAMVPEKDAQSVERRVEEAVLDEAVEAESAETPDAEARPTAPKGRAGAPTLATAAEVAATEAEVAAEIEEAETASAASAPQAEGAQADAAQEAQAAAPQVAAEPASAPQAVAQVPQPATAVAPAAAPAPAPSAKPVKAPKERALAPELEAKIKRLAESYQLESGFDPEGAIQKLKNLKKQVPANARVQKDIDRALKAIGG